MLRTEKYTDWRFRQHNNFRGPNFTRFRDHKLALYDGALRYIDTEIGRLLDALQLKGLLEETLIIVTSDHGEEFWDHARQERAMAEDPRNFWGIGHGHSMYQELLWVPLIMRGPMVPAGLRVDCTARLVDIMPTALQILGLPVPQGIRGKSLVPQMLPDAAASGCQPTVSLAESPAYGPDSKAIVYDRYKLVYRPGGVNQLFDLEADPAELSDLADERPDLVAELIDLMEQELAGIDRSDPGEAMELSPGTVEQLRALGYLD